MLLAAFQSSSELVQTFIPYKTLFKITLSMIPVPTHLSEAAWNISASWRHPQSRSSEQFCEFFGQLGRISGNQNSFSYFQIVFGDAFGWYLEAFLVVSSCRFSFLWDNDCAFVALCSLHTRSKHLASQLDILAISWVVHKCCVCFSPCV